jgi:chorismate mutase/prephenate dehydratase
MSTSPPPSNVDLQKLSGLDDLRDKLDEVDQGIVTALLARDALVREVARRKAEKGIGRVRDPVREAAMLARLSAEAQAHGLDGFFVTRLFREVIDHSVRLQEELLAREQSEARAHAQELTVAFQGVEGAYSHLAAQRYFGPRGLPLIFRGFTTFRGMMECVRDGHAQYGVLPIENTTAGSINDAYDLLAQMDLAVVGEEIQKVEHCLVALDDVPLSDLKRVFSHPQALAQCSTFLATLSGCHVEAFHDTAGAVQRIAEEQDRTAAAIASEDAARRYGLRVIRRDIANQKENYTRMMVVAVAPETVDPRVAAKTSLIFATRHEHGALLACLSALSRRGLNLTKLESRPRPNTPWEYLFYVDFEGNLAETRVADAVAELRAQTSFLRVLGSYPARTGREVARIPAGAEAGAQRPPLSRARALAIRIPDAVARRSGQADTEVDLGAGRVGGRRVALLARLGRTPQRASMLDLARAARAAGADAIWAEPPAMVDGAAAVRRDTLSWIEDAAKLTGLAVGVEVRDPSEVDALVQRADFFVVPAAQMHDAALLRTVGRLDRPVILERSVTASIEDWLLAAEVVMNRGNHRIVLCDRGVRALDRALPGSLDLAALLALRELTHLPVLVDASRALAHAGWVRGAARASRAAGAQGIVFGLGQSTAGDPSSFEDGTLGAPQLTEACAELRAMG